MYPTVVPSPRRGASLLAVFCVVAAAAAGSARAQLSPSVTPFVNRTLFATGATNASAPAGNVIDFEENNYPAATGSGFIPTFMRLGFVSFRTGPNFQQEIIDGFNVGQGSNDVYVTLAADKNLVIADLDFGAGVLALGFDFKNTANGPTSAGLIAQPFTFRLFSGVTDLGTFTETVVPNGSTFAFAGFTSTVPITGLQITSVSASPNLDIVLDNFAISNQVPEPGTAAAIGLGALGLLLAQRFFRRRV